MRQQGERDRVSLFEMRRSQCSDVETEGSVAVDDENRAVAAENRFSLDGIGQIQEEKRLLVRQTSLVEFVPDAIVVHLEDGRSLTVPLEWFPRLRDATPEQRNHWRLIGPGTGLYSDGRPSLRLPPTPGASRSSVWWILWQKSQ